MSSDFKRYDGVTFNDDHCRMVDDDFHRLQDWHRQINQREEDDRRSRMAVYDDHLRRIADDEWRRSQDDWHTQSSMHWDPFSSSSSWNND